MQSDSAVCVDEIRIQDAQGKEIKAAWKVAKPEEIELKVALKDQPAGPMKMKVRQFGLTKSDELSLQAYSEGAHLDGFTINAGDQQGVLKGTRLDEVDHFTARYSLSPPVNCAKEKMSCTGRATVPRPPPGINLWWGSRSKVAACSNFRRR